MKTLLIMHHSLTGRTRSLADAVSAGAHFAIDEFLADSETLVQVSFCHAAEVGIEQMREADALIICTPENFGYMSGEIKAVFDRTYDAVREVTAGRSYALVVSCGNDGRGAVSAIERIMIGYGMTPAREAMIVRGELTEESVSRAYELGQYMLAALAVGLI
jgi:NAD(P)H-dependent FMN reductase